MFVKKSRLDLVRSEKIPPSLMLDYHKPLKLPTFDYYLEYLPKQTVEAQHQKVSPVSKNYLKLVLKWIYYRDTLSNFIQYIIFKFKK